MEVCKEIKRYDDSNVNTDLAAERSKCTFDIEFVTNLVDGSPYLTDIKRKAGGNSFFYFNLLHIQCIWWS